MNKFILLTCALLFSANIKAETYLDSIRGEWSNCRYEGDGVIGIYTTKIEDNNTRLDFILFSTEKDCERAMKRPNSIAIIRSKIKFDGLYLSTQTEGYSLIFFNKKYAERFKGSSICNVPIKSLLKHPECFNDNLPDFKEAIERIVDVRNREPRLIYTNGFGRLHEDHSINGIDLFTTNIYND